jgi:hypothetical protein
MGSTPNLGLILPAAGTDNWTGAGNGNWSAIDTAIAELRASVEAVTTPVASVFGRTGAVTAQTNDYTFSQIGGTIAVGQLPAIPATKITGVLGIANGGTGATIAVDARENIGAAASGVNSDITQLTDLTTPLSVAQGGTGENTLAGLVSALNGQVAIVDSDNSFTSNQEFLGSITMTSALVANSGASVNSAPIFFSGSFWTGTAPQAFSWIAAAIVTGTGDNPATMLQFSQTGSTGFSSVGVPALALTASVTASSASAGAASALPATPLGYVEMTVTIAGTPTVVKVPYYSV